MSIPPNFATSPRPRPSPRPPRAVDDQRLACSGRVDLLGRGIHRPRQLRMRFGGLCGDGHIGDPSRAARSAMARMIPAAGAGDQERFALQARRGPASSLCMALGRSWYQSTPMASSPARTRLRAIRQLRWARLRRSPAPAASGRSPGGTALEDVHHTLGSPISYAAVSAPAHAAHQVVDPRVQTVEARGHCALKSETAPPGDPGLDPRQEVSQSVSGSPSGSVGNTDTFDEIFGSTWSPEIISFSSGQ